jgi:hypothetical protein
MKKLEVVDLRWTLAPNECPRLAIHQIDGHDLQNQVDTINFHQFIQISSINNLD